MSDPGTTSNAHAHVAIANTILSYVE